MTSIYQSKTTVAEWYGSSVSIPSISSSKFIPFTSSCMGIAISLLDKKTNKKINVGLSDDYKVKTAYAAPDENLIVISRNFMSGDFSAIGATKQLSAPKTVGAILGVIVHEIGHFAYSPNTLMPQIDHINRNTTKVFNFDLARKISNTLEDIYIEHKISMLAPTLAWTLDEINRLMLTDALFSDSVKYMKTVTEPEAHIGAIMNYLLFAKITPDAKRVSPFAKRLFTMARSVVKLDNLEDRSSLCLALYNLIAPDKPEPEKNAPILPKNKPNSEPEETEETEPENANAPTDNEDMTPNAKPEETEDSEPEPDDAPEDNYTGSVESTDDDTDDLEDTDDTEDTDDDLDDTDDDLDDETEDTDDDQNSNASDNEETEPEPEPEDNDISGESELGHDTDAIPQIDTYQTRDNAPLPEHRIMQTDLGYKPSLDGHVIIEKSITANAVAIEMDKRYTKLSEMARQRTNANIGFGQQSQKGRNMRQLYRIVTDQKVFSTRIIQETVKPMDVKIVLDCSGSMGLCSSGTFETKLMNASRATLGAATGLINGKCTVAVYGHTSDPWRDYKQVLIYDLLHNGESPNILARRLTTINNDFGYLFYNRDGYALHEISKKFLSKDKKKIMIVISDGAPNGDGNGSVSYDGTRAVEHTRETVKAIRASGIAVYSISIDRSAYQTNNYIYGREFNTCAPDANAIDELIRQLYA